MSKREEEFATRRRGARARGAGGGRDVGALTAACPQRLSPSARSVPQRRFGEIVYPFLSVFLTALGASALSMGVIEGAAESVSSFLKLFAGYFSDRLGRRKGLVVFGYALAGTMRTLLGFATSWTHVLAMRLSDRVGKGIRSAPRDAMIADAAAPEERGLAFGLHRAMDHAGAVIGPLFGFIIIALIARDTSAPSLSELRTLFLLAAVPALAAVLVAALFVRDAPREVKTDLREVSPPPRLSLRGFDTNFKRFLVVLALFTLANSSDLFVLRRAQEAGVGAATIPLLWAALHACKVLTSLVGGDLSDRLGRKRMIVSGWVPTRASTRGSRSSRGPSRRGRCFCSTASTRG